MEFSSEHLLEVLAPVGAEILNNGLTSNGGMASVDGGDEGNGNTGTGNGNKDVKSKIAEEMSSKENATKNIASGKPATQDVVAKNVAIDSREITGLEIFVPVNDIAHDFISDAASRGAPIIFTAKKELAVKQQGNRQSSKQDYQNSKQDCQDSKQGHQNSKQDSSSSEQDVESNDNERTIQQSTELSTSNSSTLIYVKDTVKALATLAKHVRQKRLNTEHIIGITGSVGKTSTKDFTKAALSSINAHASQASFNNHLGVPLTLCNADKNAGAIVAEVGASAPGEIASLTDILSPTIGIVTAIGAAHIEGFKDFEGVLKEKGDLLESLPKSGTAILSADILSSNTFISANPNSKDTSENNHYIANQEILAQLIDRTEAEIFTYGISDSSRQRRTNSSNQPPASKTKVADIVATNISIDENLRATFQLESPFNNADQKIEVKLPVAGSINIKNALAALAVAGVIGVDLEVAAASLAEAKLSPLRMELKTTASGAKILNDTYNANPISMKAALRELASLNAKRRIAVLGTMRELGDIHDQAHFEVAEFAKKLGVQLLSFNEPAYRVDGVTEAELAEMFDGLGEGDSVLFKASRGVELEKILERLM